MICFDPVATQAAGAAQFRWPFPTEDAIFNGYYVNAMQSAWKFVTIYKKDPATWNKEEIQHNKWAYDDDL
jgi:hypothetical protein